MKILYMERSVMHLVVLPEEEWNYFKSSQDEMLTLLKNLGTDPKSSIPKNLSGYTTTAWDCIRNPATHGRQTKVSLKKVGDLLENMHTRLLALASANPVQVVTRPDVELINITYAVAQTAGDSSLASGSTVN